MNIKLNNYYRTRSAKYGDAYKVLIVDIIESEDQIKNDLRTYDYRTKSYYDLHEKKKYPIIARIIQSNGIGHEEVRYTKEGIAWIDGNGELDLISEWDGQCSDCYEVMRDLIEKGKFDKTDPKF